MFKWKFGSQKQSEGVQPEHVTAILEEGVEFEGKLSFQGTARIAGKFKGEILASDNLIIGKGACVYANIEVNSIVINGEVIGDIIAKEKVEILAPAKFKGNIKTPSLYIEEGAVYEGMTKMDAPKQQPVIANNPTVKPRLEV